MTSGVGNDARVQARGDVGVDPDAEILDEPGHELCRRRRSFDDEVEITEVVVARMVVDIDYHRSLLCDVFQFAETICRAAIKSEKEIGLGDILDLKEGL
jgi:hypothetical protein